MRYPNQLKKTRRNRLSCECLEQRNLLAGDFLRVIDNPSTTLQPLSEAGSSVAVNEGIIAVGAPWDDSAGKSDIGQVHLYEQSSGQLLRSLQSERPASGGRFGQSIDISDGHVVVSTPFSNVGAIDAGLVEVFDLEGNSTRTLLNPTPAPLDYFGWSIAADGDSIVVGAYLDDAFGLDAGAAHVFSSSSGELLFTLSSPEIVDSDYFGFSVAISDGVIAVGARRADVGAVDDGAVYLFDATNGEFLREIDNPTPQSFDSFGRSVSLSGDLLVVGADGDNTGAAGSGAAYVFSVSTGELLHTLINPSPTFVDFFGASVAISQDQVVVGAIRADDVVRDAGAAYAFSTATGELLQTWNNPTPGELDVFGASMAIDESSVVVGAYWDDTAGTDAGAAYVFSADTGELAYELLSPTLGAFNYFGYSVAVSGDLVAAGAPFEDVNNITDVGVVFLSNAKTGELLRTISNPDPVASDAFGYSLAMSGDLLVVGAHRANKGAIDSGIAYVFSTLTGELVSTLNNPLPATQDFFGLSVAVWNEQVVVGAHRKNSADGVADVGVAYLFDAYSGELTSTFENPDPDAFDFFGFSVAIYDGRVAIGAYQDDHGAINSGSVYVFDSFDPENARHIPNPQPSVSDQFGYSVSIWDKSLAVGAPRKDIGDFDAGAVYLFHALSGVEQHVLFDAIPKTSGNFGGEVSMSGDLLAVGAHQRDFPNVAGAGSVDLFDPSTGTLKRQLANPSPMEDDFFGWSIAVGSNITAVGTPLVDGATTDRGAVSVFFSDENSAPFSLAGGPYAGSENEPLTFVADSVSDDRDVVSDLTIEWDLDYDGLEFDADATGLSPQVTFDSGFAVRDIALKVTDRDGAAVIATSTLQVNSRGPSVPVLEGTVVVAEGDLATNAGTVFDSSSGNVALSASVGELVANEDGTWDWSFQTSDGPAESQTVTIVAKDSDEFEASIEFDLVVENVAPALAVNHETVYFLEGIDPVAAGTVTDAASDEIVSIASSVGSVTHVGDGVWDWGIPFSEIADAQVIEVLATDSDGASSAVSFEVISTRIVADVASLSVVGGSMAVVEGQYSQIVGTELTLTASVGEIVDNADGTWSWSYQTVDGPDDSQEVSLVAEHASVDGSVFSMSAFDLIVENVAPLISTEQTTVSAFEGGDAIAFGEVLDPDGDGFVLTASVGMVVDNGDGTWEWSYTVEGESPGEATITVTDDDGAASSVTFAVSIENSPPVVEADSDLIRVLAGEVAHQQGSFGDLGGDPVTLESSIGTVVDNGDGTWEWTYLSTSTETLPVTITATDSDESSAAVAFELRVTNLVVDTTRVESVEGEVVRQTGRYAIPAVGELQLSASVGEIVDNGDGTWEWTYTSLDGPDESQMVTVWSSYPDSAVFIVDFEMVVRNAAPLGIANATEVSAFIGTGASNSGSYIDPGGDMVELSASAGDVIDNGDGSWGWSTDDVGEVGISDVFITFTDEDGTSSQIVFTLEALPRIDGETSSVVVNEGEIASLTGNYFDSGEAVELSASFGEIVDEGDWNWSWSVDASGGPLETQIVTLVADYGDGAVFFFEFELFVLNRPPQLSVDQDIVDVRDGELATNHGSYEDVAFDDVVLSASVGEIVDNGDGTWSWSMETTDGPDDSQVVTIVASDTDGDSSEISFQVLDADATQGPTVLDLHQDGIISVLDLDAIVSAIVGMDPESRFDVSGDGALNSDDIDYWLSNAAPQLGFAAPLLMGDANLDGAVNSADLNAMALNWQGAASTWSEGDFNADGMINAADLNLMAINWQESLAPLLPAAAAIPTRELEGDAGKAAELRTREAVFEKISNDSVPASSDSSDLVRRRPWRRAADRSRR